MVSRELPREEGLARDSPHVVTNTRARAHIGTSCELARLCGGRRAVSRAERKGQGKWTCKPNSVLRLRGVTIIPLGLASLPGSSDLPEGSDAPSRCVSAEADSLPIWSCSVWGLPCPGHCCPGGALLPHLFTLIHLRRTVCFLWHWPSSGLEAGIPDVIRHTALRSSDFPLPHRNATATARSTCL